MLFRSLWQREQNILNHRWKDLITYTYPDKYSFDPVLQSGMYLIGELEDGRKISLGQIDLMRADYY